MVTALVSWGWRLGYQLDPFILASTFVLRNFWRKFWSYSGLCISAQSKWNLFLEKLFVPGERQLFDIPGDICHIIQKPGPEFLNVSTIGILGWVIPYCRWLFYVPLWCLAASTRYQTHFSPTSVTTQNVFRLPKCLLEDKVIPSWEFTV